ncbi:MAG: hypothetical protein JO025_22340 [Verrucomicrobia bacterium]|nr:hypothetical protein [Verrucomicrobiota bacterium]
MMKASLTMPRTEPRLGWIQQAAEPGALYFAECGPYSFEICYSPDQGYVLQMWQLRPEDWPLLVWEMDGYRLAEAQARAERLANQHVPIILTQPL